MGQGNAEPLPLSTPWHRSESGRDFRGRTAGHRPGSGRQLRAEIAGLLRHFTLLTCPPLRTHRTSSPRAKQRGGKGRRERGDEGDGFHEIRFILPCLILRSSLAPSPTREVSPDLITESPTPFPLLQGGWLSHSSSSHDSLPFLRQLRLLGQAALDLPAFIRRAAPSAIPPS